MPPLLLQPLLENAVTHGIAGLLDGGVIRLDVARRDDRLSIAIENPRDADAARPTRGGVGLDNVRQRLVVDVRPRRAPRNAAPSPARFRVAI